MIHISKLLQCNSNYISSSPHQFRMLVNEYASALYTEKDYITCGNITDLKNVTTQGFHWENLILLLKFYAYLMCTNNKK